MANENNTLYDLQWDLISKYIKNSKPTLKGVSTNSIVQNYLDYNSPAESTYDAVVKSIQKSRFPNRQGYTAGSFTNPFVGTKDRTLLAGAVDELYDPEWNQWRQNMVDDDRINYDRYTLLKDYLPDIAIMEAEKAREEATKKYHVKHAKYTSGLGAIAGTAGSVGNAHEADKVGDEAFIQSLKNNPDVVINEKDLRTLQDIYTTNTQQNRAKQLALTTGVTGAAIATTALPYLNGLSTAAKAYLATNSPNLYAGLQLGTGALRTKWAYDGAKDIITERVPELIQNVKDGNYTGALINTGVGAFDAWLAKGAPAGLTSLKQGATHFATKGVAKMLDKGIRFGKPALMQSSSTAVGTPTGSWSNQYDNWVKGFNRATFNNDKYRPMLMNLIPGAVLESYNQEEPKE